MNTISRATNKLLVVDDEPLILESLADLFADEYVVLTASSGREAIDAVASDSSIAVVILDIKMSGMDGIEAASEITIIRPDISIIFNTGFPGEYREEEIDRDHRPFDFIVKGGSINRLERTVRNAFAKSEAEAAVQAMSGAAMARFGIVGRSANMERVFEHIVRAGVTDCKVLIRGETGTGKELVAKALHDVSPRSKKPFEVYHAFHKEEGMGESELFGHTRGAYTGATSSRKGVFDLADEGTVFLDEIGELDRSTQSKLLRVLDYGEYKPLGSTRMQRTDVRILSATHRNLEKMVEDGTFREDLFYRLGGIQIVIPPLRDRQEDIPLLIEHFRRMHSCNQSNRECFFTPDAVQAMMEYHWPGNVRELGYVVERLMVLSTSESITSDQVLVAIGDGKSFEKQLEQSASLTAKVEQFRRNLIVEAMHRNAGNISATARQLVMDVANLRKLLRKLMIDPEDFK